MTDSPADTERALGAALAKAREAGDPDALAEALAVHANALVSTGRMPQARAEIDEAAAIHRARGRSDDDARYTLLAATVSRLSGDLEGARERATRVLSAVPTDSPLAASATTELVEVALASRRPEEAVSLSARVLKAATTGLPAALRATLLRKRASALAAMGQIGDAIVDLTEALALLRQHGERPAERRTMVELATALQQHDVSAAQRVRAEALEAARAAGDHQVIADLHLLEAADAATRRDGDAAMTAALAARDEALVGVSPVAYTSAAATVAKLAEARGDRVTAYEALAVGWVTLRDLLGDGVARRAFEPSLLDLRARWGAPVFDAVKREYEERRRQVLAR